MSIQPIDLQTLLLRLNQVGQEQSAERHSIAQSQAVTGSEIAEKSQEQERRLDEGLRSLGLTRTTWCILLAVGNEDLSQPSEIAEFVGVDRTATSRALRAMEEGGLISRRTGCGACCAQCVGNGTCRSSTALRRPSRCCRRSPATSSLRTFACRG